MHVIMIFLLAASMFFAYVTLFRSPTGMLSLVCLSVSKHRVLYIVLNSLCLHYLLPDGWEFCVYWLIKCYSTTLSVLLCEFCQNVLVWYTSSFLDTHTHTHSCILYMHLMSLSRSLMLTQTYFVILFIL